MKQSSTFSTISTWVGFSTVIPDPGRDVVFVINLELAAAHIFDFEMVDGGAVEALAICGVLERWTQGFNVIRDRRIVFFLFLFENR